MQRFLILVFSLLLFSVSPPEILAQEVQEDSSVAPNQTVAPETNSKQSQQVKSQSLSAVSLAKLSPANAPAEITSTSSPGQNTNKPSEAGQEPKPLTRKVDIPRKGITIQYPDDWSVGPKRFENLTEIIDLPANKQNQPITTKIKITTEERKDHAEALRRLEEIRTGIGAPTSSFLTIGGWPAIQFGRIEERPTPGKNFPRPQFKDKKMYRITTVIAAGDLIVRMEAALPSDASPGLIKQVQAITRSAFFSTRASLKKTENELASLRKGPVRVRLHWQLYLQIRSRQVRQILLQAPEAVAAERLCRQQYKIRPRMRPLV